jgi:hypothetical protein
MSDRFAKVRSSVFRLRLVAHDKAMALACRLLLPIATTCKVCNIMRGIGIGIIIGGHLAILLWSLFGRG